MTVRELIEALHELANAGYEDTEVKVWEPDYGGWYAISGYTCTNKEIKLYADED